MEEIITISYDSNKPDDSCLLCMRTLKDGRHSISVGYTQHNADEMYKMLTKQGYLAEHDAKIRADAIDEFARAYEHIEFIGCIDCKHLDDDVHCWKCVAERLKGGAE